MQGDTSFRHETIGYFCPDHGDTENVLYYNDLATILFNPQETAIKQLFHQNGEWKRLGTLYMHVYTPKGNGKAFTHIIHVHVSFKRSSSAHSSCSQALHLLAKSMKSLGHPITLHTPAIVKIFRVVGWPVIPSIALLKVRNI